MMLEKVSVLFVVMLLVAGLVGVVFGSGSDNGEQVVDGVEEVLTNGSGTLNDPYMIYDVHELQNMTANLTAHYALANDIDASETKEWNDGRGFEPIGEWGNRFTGSLNGHNFTISELSINRPSTWYIGIFGYIGSGGEVRNLGVVSADVSGEWFVGGMAGRNEGDVTNSYATGNVSGNLDVGGLVGSNEGTIKKSYAIGNVSGDDRSVGGLVGRNEGTMSNSYATSNVSGDRYVGGLVGENENTISNSYANGNVSGNDSLGGLVGFNWGIVSNSYTMGIVSGNSRIGGLVGLNSYTVLNSHANANVTRVSGLTSTYIGAFVGHNDQSKIINCYSTGRVTYENATDPVDKGFAGGVDTGGNYEMTGNFWDVETSKQNATAGNATGKTTTEMKTKSTFTNASWDFKYTWYIVEGITYPMYLWYSGNGTEDNPFEIHDIFDLQDMNLNFHAHYVLANDIDASETSEWNGGAGFEPVRHFTGNLDGLGYNITGLYINRPITDRVGLFGSLGLGGGVQNLGLIDVNVSGDDRGVGGLVGENYGTVDNSYATGNVNGDRYVGGLMGRNIGGSVSNSYTTGNTSGDRHVGGLVGWNRYGTVSNSYATGNVSGSGWVGGLVGWNLGTVSNCSATGNVNGNRYVGGLMGVNEGTVSNSYNTGRAFGNDGVGGLVGMNWGSVSNSHYNIDDVLINGGHYVTIGGLFDEQYQDWFDNGLNLEITDYNDTLVPSGDYYEISSVEGFRDILGFAGRRGYKFRLVADINLSTEPGLYVPYLTAEFDGQNYSVSNLHIDISFAMGVGMFGYLGEVGGVKNLGMVNIDITGWIGVGGLVGRNIGGSISNSYTTGNISGNISVGGLAGFNIGTVENCYTIGSINGETDIGGLVGYNGLRGTIKKSYAIGNVNGYKWVGGLLGYNFGTVENSHATGTTTGEVSVGGLVGTNDETVSNSYATGNVNGGSSSGGLVGFNNGYRGADGFVIDSYATGNVSGTSSVGGLIGANYYGGVVKDSYAEGAVIGQSDVGGFVGGNYLWCTISNSYATGSVTRKAGSETSFGGFVGLNYQSSIINCFSIGGVTYEESADPTDKGFAGNVTTGEGYEMTGNFWDVETSGQNATAGNAEGKTTAEMIDLSTFVDADWDVTDVPDTESRDTDYIWNIVDHETYPFFSWQDFVFGPYRGLTINIEGSGSTEPEEGVHTYTYGTQVNLTAFPDEGWYFSHWTGDVPNGQETNENITIVMDGNKAITAHFEQIYHNLTISVEGEGSTSPNEGDHTYAYGTEVTITATPETGWYFCHWAGDVPEGEENNEEITIVMDADKNITVHFLREEYTLDITAEGEGVTDPPAGTHVYEYEDEVTVTATPETGWRFSHWGGDVPEGEEESEELTIMMDGDKTVTAHFEQIYYNLTVNIDGDGTTVLEEGDHSYAYGTEVNLTATPDEGWYFSHWSGDVPESQETNENITIVMDSDKNITAHFHEISYPSIEIISPEYDRVFDSGYVTVEWRSEEGTYPVSHYEIRLNDGNWMNVGTATTHTFTVTEPGDHIVSVRVFDDAGNVDVDSTRFAIEDSSVWNIWWLLLLVIVIIVIIISVFLRKRSSGEKDEMMQEEEEQLTEEQLTDEALLTEEG